MGQKICCYLAIYIFILKAFSIFGQNNKLVNLKRISYQQGQLTDQITFFFDNTVASIYDPEPADRVRKFSNYKKVVSFFLPFVNVRNSDAKKMISIINDTNKNGYKVKIDSVVRPLKGLKIYIGYDSELINWEYNKIANNNSRLVFKFYNKKELEKINQKTSPLRWYAYANHNPKIVLDHNLCSVKSNEIFNLKKLLERNGFQVCLIKNTNLKTSHDFAASYSNIIERPDVYIYLADKINNHRLLEDRNKLQKKLEFVEYDTKIKVNTINSNLALKNEKLELCINGLNTQASSSLLGFEMPSVFIYINEYLKDNLAQNLVSGIIKYFENSGMYSQKIDMNIVGCSFSNKNRGKIPIKFSIN